ncbi:hypothetical protein [Dactylosporangium sp. NPDC049140]|uniref:hypothetical protein n=1 Tax=Dactylosporangium sp. NPDC049140 TaxID=3155647 RepID=UPI0033C9F38E
MPDGTTIRLFVDDDPVTCETTEVRQFDRALDMRRGVLDRSVVYQLPDGRRFRVDTRRFVSLAHRHMACLRYEVTALDAPGRLMISSELLTPRATADGPALDPRQSRALTEATLEPGLERVDNVRVIRTYRTARSELVVAVGMDHEFDEQAVTHVRTKVDGDRADVAFEAYARPGQTVTLTKWLAYHYGAENAAHLADRAGGDVVPSPRHRLCGRARRPRACGHPVLAAQ